jgi:hypothetical protein
MKKTFYRADRQGGLRNVGRVLDKWLRLAVNRTSMAKKMVVILTIGFAFGLVRYAEAQQPAKIPRIGI